MRSQSQNRRSVKNRRRASWVLWEAGSPVLSEEQAGSESGYPPPSRPIFSKSFRQLTSWRPEEWFEPRG